MFGWFAYHAARAGPCGRPLSRPLPEAGRGAYVRAVDGRLGVLRDGMGGCVRAFDVSRGETGLPAADLSPGLSPKRGEAPMFGRLTSARAFYEMGTAPMFER